MKTIKNLTVLFSFFLFGLNLFAQCPDSSTATLQETTDWIKSKIESLGGRQLPPTRYEVKFKNSDLEIIEFGMNSDFELKDTTSICKVNMKNLDFPKLKVKYINNSKTRFSISFDGKNKTMSIWSPTLGNLEGGYEVIISCENSPDLAQRMLKAFIHLYCLSGGGTIVKETF